MDNAFPVHGIDLAIWLPILAIGIAGTVIGLLQMSRLLTRDRN